jgi:hypothetical protein
MSESRLTTDHEEIRKWVEARGGHPARVRGTNTNRSSGVLAIDYPGFSGAETLEAIDWDEFFKGFEENGLALLYQDNIQDGRQSRFSKLVNRENIAQKRRSAGS